MSTRVFSNTSKLINLFNHHCPTPFSSGTKLMNIASGMEVAEKAKEDILYRDQRGVDRHEQFVKQRLLHSSELSLWDPIKKLKLKTFSNWSTKSEYSVGGQKVVKLREDRSLLAHWLLMYKSRPELADTLPEAIGKFEFSTISRTYCYSDGSLISPDDKSELINEILKYCKEKKSR